MLNRQKERSAGLVERAATTLHANHFEPQGSLLLFALGFAASEVAARLPELVLEIGAANVVLMRADDGLRPEPNEVAVDGSVLTLKPRCGLERAK